MKTISFVLSSRGDRIRTYDLHVPNVARYRAALRPEGRKIKHSSNIRDREKQKMQGESCIFYPFGGFFTLFRTGLPAGPSVLFSGSQ